MKNKSFLEATAIMVGCIIGGGILALPYAVSRSGFWSSIILIVALGLMMMFINIRISEINIALKKPHQVVGLVERFLGKTGKILMTAAMLLLCYGALIAYSIGSAEILALLGGSILMWKLAFYIIGAIVVAYGLKTIGGSELVMEIAKLLIVGLIVVLGMSHGFNPNLFTGFQLQGIGMVFGVALFASLGLVSVPIVFELVRKKSQIKKVIFTASLTTIAVYLLFVMVVIAKTGAATTEVATIGLKQAFSPFMGIMINIFALLALTTSFLAVAYSVYEMFLVDFNLNKTLSFILAFMPPLIGMFILESFAKTIDIVGALAGSMMVILLILAHRKAKRRFRSMTKVPILLDLLFLIIFILGAVMVFI